MVDTARHDAGDAAAAPASPTAQDLLAEARQVGAAVAATAGAALTLACHSPALLRRQLERRPYATLAVAGGIGFALGGGLPPALLRVAIGIGGRLAVELALSGFTPPDPGAP